MKLNIFARAPLALAVLSLSLLTLWGCPNPVLVPSVPALGDTVAHWTFDGTLRDITGHGHDGSPIGTIHYTEDRWKMKGRALLLDSGASVAVHDSSDLHFTNTSSFTISFWIRTKSSADAGIYSWGRSDGKTPGITLSLKAGKPHVGITATPTDLDLTGPNSVADNAWHLLTVTVSAQDTVKLYVDTTVVAHSNGGMLHPNQSNNGRVRIGRLPDSTGQFLGEIAKGIIFKIAVGFGTVRTMYLDDQTSTPPITGVCAPDEHTLFAVDNNGRALRSTDGTANFSGLQPITPELWAVDAFDATHAMAVGADGSIFTYNGSSWVPQPQPLSGAATIYAVKFIDPEHVLIAGGDDNQPSGFVLRGTGQYPNYNWTSVLSTPKRSFSTLAVKGTAATVAGWDGQIYNSPDGINFTPVAASNTAAHYTSFDYGSTPSNGVVVTDDGYAYDVSGGSVGSVIYSLNGYAFWTTAVVPTGTYIGGGIGTTQPQLSGILSKNGMPVSGVPPDHVWFSSCKTPISNEVRIGGYEGQQMNVYFGQ